MDDSKRCSRCSALAQIDGLFELSKLGRNMLFQGGKTVLLRGIVDRQSLERVEARARFLRRGAVWTEIAFVSGKQIAPLAGFGVFYRGKHVVQRSQRVTGVDNEGAICL